ncbi:peptide chain release factor N(5)-glutamine methyltransferase [Erysipelothrix urinaevulpis]|uniref:peptide chain release factor N(5)-glutamine methyltransferase n=1 Tax=Erysipelothrix urinaevulpis TaxID=2683717 RepID=UPI001359DA21|nr:peptide chain release factor N(5)-glutamine methyltransferase [Erysipelothrix urinaevulpis]
MTYKELIQATERNAKNPDLIRVLLLEMLRERNLDLYLELENEVDEAIIDQFNDNFKRLENNEPLAYVLGYQWFYDSRFLVNENVLIPRPETEELVNNILMDIDEYFEEVEIVDVATGSGAIAVSLAKDLGVAVDASDISQEALNVAKENAELNQADVSFYQGDMLEPIINLNKKYDVLVCNPPYIKEVEDVQTSVLDFEPHVALFGGDDGLYFYRKVFDKASLVLKPRSMMAFEIGFDIGDALVELAQQQFPNATVVLKQDINNLDRMLFVYQGIKVQE